MKNAREAVKFTGEERGSEPGASIPRLMVSFSWLEIPRFRGHPVKHENVRGVVHGKAEEKEVHG